MNFRLKNTKFLQNHIKNYAKVIERTLIREMEIVVSKLQNHAKESSEYEDQTGNLKGSIGGLVLKDGIPIDYSGFEGEGGEEGKNYINTLIDRFGSGYVILIVAGMEYASYVENYHNLNVLKKTELLLPSEMKKMFNRIEKALNK